MKKKNMKNVLFTRSLKKLYYRCTILTLDIYDQKYVVHKTYLKITLLKGFIYPIYQKEYVSNFSRLAQYYYSK